MTAALQEHLPSIQAPIARSISFEHGASGLKRALTLRAQTLTSVEFIKSRLCPLLGSRLSGTASDCEAKIVRNTGTGRLTIRYVFDRDVVVFGKLFHDDLGCRSFRVNEALWEYGFNDAGRYRVPEPLAYFPDHALLLMLGVKGTPLSASFDGDCSVDMISRFQEAAEWLAALHLATLRIGSPELGSDALRHHWAEDHVIKVVARRPDKANMIRDLIKILGQRVATLRSDRDYVLTHGRYNHDHVFLGANTTSVIDLDRCRPSDPAKDLAEFILTLRLFAFHTGARHSMELAGLATSAFLSSYLARLPQAADNLGCYWATFAFHRLLRCLGQSRHKCNANWEDLEKLHLQEINTALEYGR